MTKIERLDVCKEMAETLPNVPQEAKAIIARLIVESFELASNFGPTLAMTVMSSCVAACSRIDWSRLEDN